MINRNAPCRVQAREPGRRMSAAEQRTRALALLAKLREPHSGCCIDGEVGECLECERRDVLAGYDTAAVGGEPAAEEIGTCAFCGGAVMPSYAKRGRIHSYPFLACSVHCKEAYKRSGGRSA